MHTSVLLKEIVDGLAIQRGDIIVDGTVNGGGMSEEIVTRFGDSIRLFCIDQDENALSRAKKRLGEKSDLATTFILGNYKHLRTLPKDKGIEKINRFLLDLGLSSTQLEGGVGSEGRGFSFGKAEPLLMTYDAAPTEESLTAKDVVNSWSEENIETILRIYGEERLSRKIARVIVAAREIKPIATAKELGDIIEKGIGRRGRTHPATKTFQAIRIAVNDELGSLKQGLEDGFEMLAPGGRMAVISFHSLEDRIVKNFVRDRGKEGVGKVITKRPITPGEAEARSNPRSRSAKLRIIEKNL